ncbi:PIN domain-containing protein [Methyloglobulus sp.]|uniref:PIN domain-containing protein n=1 Tax=Methyloglobulus sp. TaxID=2518622 RepID=UPI0039897741
MIAVDTNVLLRYLLKPVDSHNPKWQNEAAETLINQVDKVFVPAIVIAEIEWVLEGVFGCGRQAVYSVIHELASHTKFQFDDWAALNNALLDYLDYVGVDLSDCLIARQAQNVWAETLYTFENEKKLGAFPVATTLR